MYWAAERERVKEIEKGKQILNTILRNSRAEKNIGYNSNRRNTIVQTDKMRQSKKFEMNKWASERMKKKRVRDREH